MRATMRVQHRVPHPAVVGPRAESRSIRLMIGRHCERSEAIQLQGFAQRVDCFVASLLAMTAPTQAHSLPVESGAGVAAVGDRGYRRLAAPLDGELDHSGNLVALAI
jgi:hypothetical protein